MINRTAEADPLNAEKPGPVHLPITTGDPQDEVEVQWEQVAGIPKEWCGPLRQDHPNQAHVQILDRQQGTVLRTRNKVCIVGYAECSRHLAWWDDPDTEIWGVNQLQRFIPRADRWFQIHDDWDDKRKWVPGTDQAQFLAELQMPVYMLKAYDEIPNSLVYPKQLVMDTLKVHDYFTSSIAYMIALAIAEGFKEIGIYGIDLIVGTEYFFEKPCAEFYLGIAHARGIEYHLPQGCALLWQSHAYGYEQEPDYGFFGMKKMEARAGQLRDQVQLKRDVVHELQGRVEEALFFRDKVNEAARPQLDAHIEDLKVKLDKALNVLYVHDGAYQEVQRMHGILELKSRGGMVK